MVRITIITGAYKPTNITGGASPMYVWPKSSRRWPFWTPGPGRRVETLAVAGGAGYAETKSCLRNSKFKDFKALIWYHIIIPYYIIIPYCYTILFYHIITPLSLYHIICIHIYIYVCVPLFKIIQVLNCDTIHQLHPILLPLWLLPLVK